MDTGWEVDGGTDTGRKAGGGGDAVAVEVGDAIEPNVPRALPTGGVSFGSESLATHLHTCTSTFIARRDSSFKWVRPSSSCRENRSKESMLWAAKLVSSRIMC